MNTVKIMTTSTSDPKEVASVPSVDKKPQSTGMTNFIKSLEEMGVHFTHSTLGDMEVVDLVLPQRRTEGVRFVFRHGYYINHRIQKV